VNVGTLTSARETVLRAENLTYPEVGSTLRDMPEGYRRFVRSRRLPTRGSFDLARAELFAWQVQCRAGLQVLASSDHVETDAVVDLLLGIGRLSLVAPCRVVYVIDEPGRCGFAYGTLPGHPESGEEAFVLTTRADRGSDLTVIAFSRPATALSRLAGPAGQMVQDVITSRYLRSLTP
jgi:uncharacterized protein (UPF0548 family)